MLRNEDEFRFPAFTEEESFEGSEEEWKAEEQRRKFMQEQLSSAEKFHFILGAVAGGLVIAGVFLVVFFLFLLFATKIWLR